MVSSFIVNSRMSVCCVKILWCLKRLLINPACLLVIIAMELTEYNVHLIFGQIVKKLPTDYKWNTLKKIYLVTHKDLFNLCKNHVFSHFVYEQHTVH